MSMLSEVPVAECSETLADLSRRLATLADYMVRFDQPETIRIEADIAPPSLFVRRVLQARRKRETLFPDLFADPAWDLLLDLFVATEEGRDISVTSACVGANVPATTALRSISMLERRGLVVRRPHPSDRRGVLLNLSEDARQRMLQWCSQIGRIA